MLTRAITALLNTQDRFYADFIQQMDRVYTDKIPTAGVRITNRIELSVNPKWFGALSLEMQVMTLKHECLHIISEHIERVKAFSPDAITHQFYNMCMDLAVNSLIPGFPDRLTIDGKDQEFCTVANFKREYTNLQAGMPFEYYVGYFRQEEQDQKKLSEAIKNMGFDDHSGLYESSNGEPTEVQKQIIRHTINTAVEAAKRAGSNPPAGLKGLIDRAMKSKSDWQRALRRFPEEAEVCDIEATRKIRNRRYGVVYPGHKKVRRKKIAIGFDVSGSIGTDIVAALMSECDKIIEAGCELVVLFFGTGIVREETWTKTPDLRTYQVPDGGGTLFQPVYDRARELKADALIMLTDGYNFDQGVRKPTCPVLFGIIGNRDYKSAFGKVLYIESDAA